METFAEQLVKLGRVGSSCRTTGEVGHDVVALANRAQMGA